MGYFVTYFFFFNFPPKMDTIITAVQILFSHHVYLSSSGSLSVCPVTVAFSVCCPACVAAICIILIKLFYS